MTALPTPSPERVSVEEYFRREELSETKHEYHEGEILEMSGASFRHSEIVNNFSEKMRSLVRGSPCQAYGSDIVISPASGERYVYPDGSVICGPPEFDPLDQVQRTVLNPRVIIEVLSDSTEAYDRGEKFYFYQHIKALEEYVLISQNKPFVETYLRTSATSWAYEAYEGIDASLRLRSMSLDISMREVYSGVTFVPATRRSAAGSAASTKTVAVARMNTPAAE